MQLQLFAALLLSPVAAFVAGPMAPRASPALRSVSTAQPQMLLNGVHRTDRCRMSTRKSRSNTCPSLHLLSLCAVPSDASTGAPTPAELSFAIDTTTQLLAAKKPGDELVDEIFLQFPTVFTGIVFAFFVTQYIQTAKPTEAVAELLKDLPVPWEILAVPVIAVGFAVLGKIGVLGAISGVVAKGSLDGWNVFANVALPGAILKY